MLNKAEEILKGNRKIDRKTFASLTFWFDNSEACNSRPHSEEFYRFTMIKEILFDAFANNVSCLAEPRKFR